MFISQLGVIARVIIVVTSSSLTSTLMCRGPVREQLQPYLLQNSLHTIPVGLLTNFQAKTLYSIVAMSHSNVDT